MPDADVLVIDDASTDDTRRSSPSGRRPTPDPACRARRKRGLGDAYEHAFGLALADGYDALVEIDADLSHDPAVLPTMLDLAGAGSTS